MAIKSCSGCGRSLTQVRGPNAYCGPCTLERGLKTCNRCLKEKPLDAFTVATTKLAGRSSTCKECRATQMRKAREENPERHRQYGRDWYARNPGYSRQRTLAQYGITPERFQEMYEGQDGKCALCFRALIEGQGTHVDHDHITLITRKLLCHHCNTGLGNLGDDPELLIRAAEYVLHFRAVAADAHAQL